MPLIKHNVLELDGLYLRHNYVSMCAYPKLLLPTHKMNIAYQSSKYTASESKALTISARNIFVRRKTLISFINTPHVWCTTLTFLFRPSTSNK